MKLIKIFIYTLFVINSTLLTEAQVSNKVKFKFGADIILSDSIHLLKNKNIGIVSNNGSLLTNGTHLIDSLLKLENVNVKKIFSPEHGFGLDIERGKLFGNRYYKSTQIPVISLYGKSKKPSKSMINNLDIILFDIQTIGVRFFSYLSTLYYLIEACYNNNIKLIVLDRPNPLGGTNINGPVLDTIFRSIVGIIPIPIIHGMTIAELALMMNQEIGFGLNKAELKIIKMVGWNRNNLFSDINLPWHKPSPNIPDFETVLLYPGICFFEALNISEGRGTQSPFKIIGAPFIDSKELLKEINENPISSIIISDTSFIPISIDGMASHPKYENIICNGLSFRIVDYDNFNSVQFGVKLIAILKNLYPKEIKIDSKWMNLLYGGENFTKYLLEKNNKNEFNFNSWTNQLEKFNQIRKKYLLYN